MRPSSLAQAMIEPVIETDPIRAPSTARETMIRPCSPLPGFENLSNSPAPMAAAEPPPMPLNRATICGMSVIATFLPQSQVGITPMAMPPRIRRMLLPPVMAKVARVAMTMPMPAWMMPLRAVTGEAMRLMPRMNSTAARK